MTLRVQDVGWALPRMTHRGKRVPAFDEDATTLAVAAVRGLPLEEDLLLVLLGEADADVVQAATGLTGDAERAADPAGARATVEAAGGKALLVAAYAPRMGPAYGVAARTAPGGGGGDDGDGAGADARDLPADLRELLPDDAPRVEVDQETVQRHVEAHGTTPEERTPMGAYVSPQVYHESQDARYRLVGRRCPEGHVSFPPQPRCPKCRSDALDPQPLAGRGQVYTVTVIGQGAAPAEFTTQNQALGAYAVAIVELDEGPRVVAQLTDCEPDDVAIGDPVESVFRRIYVQRDGVRYGYKFRPVPGGGS